MWCRPVEEYDESGIRDGFGCEQGRNKRCELVGGLREEVERDASKDI